MSIELVGVSKRYAGRFVVENISLEIAAGELFVLLGASGSGKSTVLRLIAGLVAPDAGTITLDGRDVTDLPPQERGTGFVFQNYSIFRHMTAARNVEFGLEIRGVPRAKRKSKGEELLDLVGLAGLGDRYARELSGGQQQRVALARPLAYEPRVLLLDEPFGALDVKIRAQLRRTLAEIQRRLHVTTVLVTHDQEEAFELADRIGVIERGHLLEMGRPDELYRRPRSSFVATFVGAGTVLVGRCVEGEVRFGDLSLPIPPETPHQEGAPVRLLVRPEQVEWSRERPAGVVLGEGSVVERSFSGASTRFPFRVPRPPRTRQVSPPTTFGEESLLVDALAPSEEALPERAWVRLSGWRVLPQEDPHVLVCARPEGIEHAAVVARRIAGALDGSVTLLSVAEDAAEAERFRAGLKSAAGSWEVRVRTGAAADAIVYEQSESFYDVVLLGADSADRSVGVGPTLRRALSRTSTPVLVAGREPARLERILICTRVGEPGKTDVRAGGWLAGRMNASVTLLHVARSEASVSAGVRSHLEQGVATLRALDVPAESRIRPSENAADGILREAVEREADLIVLGGHGPRSRSVLGRDDVTLQVLARADRPVLVVPEGSW